MARVNCSVNNCHYWAQGNECVASEILITSDQFGADQPDSWDAPQSARTLVSPVDSCMETCCKTFVPKDSQEIEDDNVFRTK